MKNICNHPVAVASVLLINFSKKASRNTSFLEVINPTDHFKIFLISYVKRFDIRKHKKKMINQKKDTALNDETEISKANKCLCQPNDISQKLAET